MYILIFQKLYILILTLTTIDNSKIINVEMQRINVGDIGKRTLYYGSKLISSQLIKGEKYDKLKPVVVITILDYEIYENHNNYITKSYIMSEKHKESIREDGITFYDIELPKMRKYIKENTERNNLLDWLIFIDNKNKEEVNMAVGRSAVIAKAKEECEYLTGEEAERRKAELIEKKRKDMASAVSYGIDVGMKRGLAKGLQQGIEQTAEKMLKNKMNIKMIIDITGLSKEKIEKIKKKL